MNFSYFFRCKLVFLLSFSLSLPGFSQIYSPKPVTALLGAMDEEIELLRQSLQNPKVKVVHGIPFYEGKIGKHRVVIVKTGIGKVNATMTAAFLLQKFRPKRLIFTGIAGGLQPDLNPGDIVIGKQTLQYDFGRFANDSLLTGRTRNPINQALNPLFFQADSLLLAAAQTAVKTTEFRKMENQAKPPYIIIGTIVTGDLFVTSETKVKELRAKFNADATEMEGAAVAQLCWQQQVPCLVIRSMSDKADSKAQESIENFKKTASYNSAQLLINMLSKLPD
ncbi:5'-methylthioadenosine/adenosylhomocysteine nucleosidase [Runella sp.]|uniref:5'-methylthioadenosine/adenosylhomocysteine nucleosidase n=1 Tax=Runella sp. TaxID=1960881 RepID=UPI003D145E81